MALTLIGYRGTGKTTIAPLLAARLGWDWIDVDIEIERRTGRTISEIFASEGEPGFRAREAGILAELLLQKTLVIAAGGGAILNPQTRESIRHSGPAVWLTASLETIAQRILMDSTTHSRRPSLTGTDSRTEIEFLLAARAPMYAETARVTVDTEGRTPESIVDEIVLSLPMGGSR